MVLYHVLCPSSTSRSILNLLLIVILASACVLPTRIPCPGRLITPLSLFPIIRDTVLEPSSVFTVLCLTCTRLISNFLPSEYPVPINFRQL